VAATPRPPEFEFDEQVRVVSATGEETNRAGWRVDSASLIGQTLSVSSARPSSSRDQWLFGLFVEFPETEDWAEWWFTADCLERVGPREEGIWKDNVDLTLGTDVWWYEPEQNDDGSWDETEEEKEADAVAEEAAQALRQLVPAQVEWHQSVEDGRPIELSLEVRPQAGMSIVDAYLTIISEPPRTWLHGEDNIGFPKSFWEPPIGEQMIFLAPGVDWANVTCEHWSTPERLLTRV
jgi:hypothetical protein